MKEITNEIAKYILKNYSDMGPKAIAEFLKIKRNSVINFAFKNKLKMSHKAKRGLYIKAFAKDFKDYNVNPEQFLNIQTKEVAYILGLLWADGCLNNCGSGRTISLHIVEKDALNIKSTLDKIGKWNFYFQKKQKKTWQNQYYIYTNNRIIYECLKNCDYKNKNGIAPDKILKLIPENLHYMFFRGLFDGDGCLYINKYLIQFNISSVYNQDWTFLSKKLEDFDINYKINRNISNKGHKSSCMRFQGKYSVPKFLDYIYKDRKIDKIGLNRKYEKYESIDRIRKHSLKTTKHHGICKLSSGKFSARIYPNLKNKLEKEVLVGIFDTIDMAIKSLNNYINKHEISTIIKEHTKESCYDTS